MLAVLIGITPPFENHEELISLLKERNEDCGAIHRIQWLVVDGNEMSNGFVVVNDPDNNDPTLLVQAIIKEHEDENEESLSKVTPEDVLELLNSRLAQPSTDTHHSKTLYSCQLWATAPAILPLRPMSGYISSHLQLEKDGIQFQKDVLSQTQVDDFLQVVQQAIETTESLLQQHRPFLILGESTFAFSEVCARSPHRFDLRLDHTQAPRLVEEYILQQACIQQSLQKWLNCNSMEDIDFDVSVVYSKPGAPHQGWHTDGHAIVEKGRYAVCLFIPLIDLSQSTGYTQFWPGSHVSSQLLGFGTVAEITESTMDGICQKGNGIWYDYQTWHRGMANTSEQTRPVLQVIFKQSWYVERDNYGTESIIMNQE